MEAEIKILGRSTIDDVASLAEVSIKTVSRVVNGEPNVRQSTKDRVELAIKELNYQPSQSARSLAGSRSYLIGLIYDSPTVNLVIDLQIGAVGNLKASGYGVLAHPCNAKSGDLIDEILAFIREYRIDGMILPPPLCDIDSLTKLLVKQNIPYVAISPMKNKKNIPAVYFNDRTAVKKLTKHLIELGHQDIAFISGDLRHLASHEREAGFRESILENNIRVSKNFIVQGDYTFDAGKAAVKKLLDLKKIPTAIVCSNDEMAYGAMHGAYEMGVSLPMDLTITGFDDSPVSKYVWPPLTTVRQPVQEAARIASQLLIELIKSKGLTIMEKTLECELVIRDSSVPPKLNS